MEHLHEGNNLRDVLVFEQDEAGRDSREVVTVASGQNLLMGAVIGIAAKSTPTTGAAAAENTGAGTMAGVTAGAEAKLGVYQVKCLTYVASPLAATFEVTDPDGLQLPEASLAAYVSDQINFDIADGSPAITVGDIFTIAIVAGSGEVKEIDAQGVAVDGTQDAFGILTADCDASLAAKKAVAIVQLATILEDGLVWPTTSPAFSAGQKTAALAQLYAKGVKVRAEA